MSLRSRLMVGMVIVALVLVATAVIVTRATESYLVAQVDDQLRAAAQPDRDLGFGGGRPERPAGVGVGVSSLYVGFVDAEGQLQTLTRPNLRREALPEPDLSGVDVASMAATSGRSGPDDEDQSESEIFTTNSVGSSLRYRVLIVEQEFNRGTVSQVLAVPLDDVDSTLDQLRRVELIATAIILGLLALVTFWVLRLGVRPIKSMTHTATAIAGGDLSQRVPVERGGTEAGELGLALNTMLARIEEAFAQRTRSEARLRRFAADASHELRTPVTTIRGYAELYRRGALEAPSDMSEAMRRTEQEAIRMGVLIEDLLLLARLDQGREMDRRPLDLAALVRDAVADAAAVQPKRPVESEIVDAAPLRGDEHRLRQVLGNVISNVLVHTDESVAMRVQLSVVDRSAICEVRDEGPGMDNEVSEQAFDRFFRADPSRARNRGGTGLGLAISQSIVEAHGGSINLLTEPGLGTTVRIELPLDQPAGASQSTASGDNSTTVE